MEWLVQPIFVNEICNLLQTLTHGPSDPQTHNFYDLVAGNYGRASRAHMKGFHRNSQYVHTSL